MQMQPNKQGVKKSLADKILVWDYYKGTHDVVGGGFSIQLVAAANLT